MESLESALRCRSGRTRRSHIPRIAPPKMQANAIKLVVTELIWAHHKGTPRCREIGGNSAPARLARLLENVHSPGSEKDKDREGNERLQHSCQLSPSRENGSVGRRKGGARVECNK